MQIWRLKLRPLTVENRSLAFHFEDQDFAIAASAYIESEFPKQFELSLSSIPLWELEVDKIKNRVTEFFFPDNEDIGE